MLHTECTCYIGGLYGDLWFSDVCHWSRILLKVMI